MKTPKTRVLVTVDTEGDDEWTWREHAGTANGARLPDFQALCERYQLPPTYLVTFDMLQDAAVAETLADISRRGAGEIGSHLHPWRTPPFDPIYDRTLTYPNELPDDLLRAKLSSLTDEVEARIGKRPLSYRAGRFGMDARGLHWLKELGYTVDSSVTPSISWRDSVGLPGGPGGPDFSDAPLEPYFPDSNNVLLAGDCPVLEVPVTIRVQGNAPPAIREWYKKQPIQAPGARLLAKSGWLRRLSMRPAIHSLDEMRRLTTTLVEDGASVINLLLHSSELVPGGSPYHLGEATTRAFYERLEGILSYFREHNLVGMTLADFASEFSQVSKRHGGAE